MQMLRGLVIVALAVMLSGCFEQSAVDNRTDHFSYAGQASGKDDTETYTWKNTRGGAQVDWGGQVGKGSISVTISDASGKQVFSRGLSGGSQEGFSGDTGSGAAGDWTIKIVFQDYTGQMGLNIRAEGAPGGFGFGG